jgi:hypothetical protein
MIKDIKMRLVNAGLAGLLVSLGGLANGEPNLRVCYYALIAGLVVGITQFRDVLNETLVRDKKGGVELFQFF